MPCSGPIWRHGLATPRAPRRPAHLELHVTHLRVAVEPHVMDGGAACARDLRPAVQLPDVGGGLRSPVLPVAVGAGTRDHRSGHAHRPPVTPSTPTGSDAVCFLS